MNRQSKIKSIVLMFVTLLLLYLIFFGHISLEDIRLHQSEIMLFIKQNYFTAVTMYLIAFFILGTLCLPGASFLIVISGFLFGFIPGVVISTVGALIGSIGAFFLIRYIAGLLYVKLEFIEYKYPLKTVYDNVKKYGAWYLFFIRVMPFVPYSVGNLMAIFKNFYFIQYSLVTYVALIPRVIFFVFIGDMLNLS